MTTKGNKEKLGSLRNHGGNGRQLQRKVAFVSELKIQTFLVFRSNLLPLRGSEIFLFDFATWKPHFWRSVLQIWACKVKLSLFKCLLSKQKYGFQAFPSYRGPHFSLLDDISKAACGNKTCFA